MDYARFSIVAVVGPTAVGKTARALEIAVEALAGGEVAGVDLISVDSRQVYQGLETLTGADVPEGFDKYRSSTQKFFANSNSSIRLFGVSIIQPSEEWSVAHFQQFARKVLLESWEEKRLPVLVGGTGLYHEALFRNDEQLFVSPNEEIRTKAEGMSVEGLQEWLASLDKERLERMNESDRANRRRLIRAIEIAVSNRRTLREPQGDSVMVTPPTTGSNHGARGHGDPSTALRMTQDDSDDWSAIKPQTILVSADLETIRSNIEQRVADRFINGAVDEVKNLLALNLPPSAPVLKTLGVSEISQFVDGQLSAEECQQLWALHEFQYAKRQLTWWKFRDVKKNSA